MDGDKQTSFTYQPDAQPVPAAPVIGESALQAPDADALRWTASEFIAHHKSAAWYVKMGGASIVVVALIWWVSDWASALFVALAFVILAIYALRKPREIPYMLDEHGFGVGQRYYEFRRFRSFSVMREGAFSSIVFTPHKRFASLTAIYYAPEDEAFLVDLISQRIPFQERKRDLIDRLMWRLRF